MNYAKFPAVVKSTGHFFSLVLTLFKFSMFIYISYLCDTPWCRLKSDCLSQHNLLSYAVRYFKYTKFSVLTRAVCEGGKCLNIRQKLGTRNVMKNLKVLKNYSIIISIIL